MGRTPSRRRTCKVRIGRAQMLEFAGAFVSGHAAHLASGYALMKSSGVWRRHNGLFTVRFVYRRRGVPVVTIVYVLRGVCLT
jgi:hypothetical protein